MTTALEAPVADGIRSLRFAMLLIMGALGAAVMIGIIAGDLAFPLTVVNGMGTATVLAVIAAVAAMRTLK